MWFEPTIFSTHDSIKYKTWIWFWVWLNNFRSNTSSVCCTCSSNIGKSDVIVSKIEEVLASVGY